mmetsp:Transcript_14318/g.29683  ORF Transcript_14318/g.29683 Transcript_14318/m.29683 type:complete len:206 (+) Transcript_14318:1793-2410(+)
MIVSIGGSQQLASIKNGHCSTIFIFGQHGWIPCFQRENIPFVQCRSTETILIQCQWKISSFLESFFALFPIGDHAFGSIPSIEIAIPQKLERMGFILNHIWCFFLSLQICRLFFQGHFSNGLIKLFQGFTLILRLRNIRTSRSGCSGPRCTRGSTRSSGERGPRGRYCREIRWTTHERVAVGPISCTVLAALTTTPRQSVHHGQK